MRTRPDVAAVGPSSTQVAARRPIARRGRRPARAASASEAELRRVERDERVEPAAPPANAGLASGAPPAAPLHRCRSVALHVVPRARSHRAGAPVVPAGAVVAAGLPRVHDGHQPVGRAAATVEQEAQASTRPLADVVGHGRSPALELGDRVAVHRRLGDRRRGRAGPRTRRGDDGRAGVADVGHEAERRPGRRAADQSVTARSGSPSSAQIDARGSTSPTATATGRRRRWARCDPSGRQCASTARALDSAIGPSLPVIDSACSPSPVTAGMSPMPTCAIVSFRLGLTDGVSVVADSWAARPGALGFDVVTVAGEGPVDRLVPGLAIDARTSLPGRRGGRRAAPTPISSSSRTCARSPSTYRPPVWWRTALRGRPAILHHHDPPWQRARFAHVDRAARRRPRLASRHDQRADPPRSSPTGASTRPRSTTGSTSTEPPGDRDATRAALGVDADELLVVHPVRAIARKDVPARRPPGRGARRHLLAARVRPRRATAPSSARVLARRRCPVHPPPAAGSLGRHLRRGRRGRVPVDLGGVRQPADRGGPPPPPGRRRALPGGRASCGALGFRWFPTRRPAARCAASSPHPDAALLDHNRALARRQFRQDRVVADLRRLLDEAGWTPS